MFQYIPNRWFGPQLDFRAADSGKLAIGIFESRQFIPTAQDDMHSIAVRLAQRPHRVCKSFAPDAAAVFDPSEQQKEGRVLFQLLVQRHLQINPAFDLSIERALLADPIEVSLEIRIRVDQGYDVQRIQLTVFLFRPLQNGTVHSVAVDPGLRQQEHDVFGVQAFE